jgi:hypothetical protein
MYIAKGNLIYWDAEEDKRAVCEQAAYAVDLLNKAGTLNDKGRYTASARMNYKAECLPGFRWLEQKEAIAAQAEGSGCKACKAAINQTEGGA